MNLRPIALGLLAATLSLGLAASDLPDLGDSSLANLPPHEEKRIADMTARELRRSGEVLDDVEVSDYLNQLGYKLVSASNENRTQFRFFPLLSPSINAWAVPGGVIGVNTGLIVLAQHESELAAVLAHEIAHVTQHHYARMVESQKGAGIMSLGTLALAILAASRGSGDAPFAAVAASQGYQTQRYLDFSRDFEREADRVGMQTLQAAGFDIRAMPTFFDRMQKFYRNVDNGAFAFLRTHPVTGERISDSEARAAQQPYRQWPDSMDFLFVRERARVLQLGAQAALAHYAGTTSQKKYADEAAQQYGYALALLQAGRHEAAWERLSLAQKALPSGHAMLAALGGNIRLAQARYDDAAALFRSGLASYPSATALQYGEIDVNLRQGQWEQAIKLTEQALGLRSGDPGLHKRLAQAYEQLKQTGPAHRALAEYYALLDEPSAALQQLQIARRAGGDFYQMSAIEARMRELRAQLAEASKHGMGPGEPQPAP